MNNNKEIYKLRKEIDLFIKKGKKEGKSNYLIKKSIKIKSDKLGKLLRKDIKEGKRKRISLI